MAVCLDCINDANVMTAIIPYLMTFGYIVYFDIYLGSAL